MAGSGPKNSGKPRRLVQHKGLIFAYLRIGMQFMFHIGRYFLLLSRAFAKPQKFSVYRKQFFYEGIHVGISSLGIIGIISVFMGGVVTTQAAFGFTSPWVPI